MEALNIFLQCKNTEIVHTAYQTQEKKKVVANFFCAYSRQINLVHSV